MRGNIYRSGRRRAASVLLVAGATLAFGLAVVLASASSALAKSAAVHARPSVAASHSPTVKLPSAAKGTSAVKLPVVIARTAGHKIA
ncbi:MAG TPA: hypothetical protein VMG37_06745 [Solirubrobacteraceae bacterium]|nr:hypothetical protein [Solirubrobacteraceae bacterium]